MVWAALEALELVTRVSPMRPKPIAKVPALARRRECECEFVMTRCYEAQTCGQLCRSRTLRFVHNVEWKGVASLVEVPWAARIVASWLVMPFKAVGLDELPPRQE